MSIRIRQVDGVAVALCAVETDAMPGDVYLDDGAHYALAAKFARDWQGRTIDWQYPDEWAAMDSQKLRDAREIYDQWHAERLLADPLASESNVSRTEQEQQDEAPEAPTPEDARAASDCHTEAASASRPTAKGSAEVAGEDDGALEETGVGIDGAVTEAIA